MFVDLKIGLLTILVGVSSSPSGQVVDKISVEKTDTFPWKLLLAPTQEDITVAYTREGRVSVKQKKGTEKLSSGSQIGRYNQKGVYSSDLIKRQSATMADFEEAGLKPFVLSEILDPACIEFVAISSDGQVTVQKTDRPSNGRPFFDVRTGSSSYGPGQDYLTEILSEADLEAIYQVN